MASSQSSLFDAPDQKNLRYLRTIAWLITIIAGFLQVWAARFTMTPDGNCYLDIATAYLRRDWHNAVNAYWSPLFSWVLALFLAIFRPNTYWESTFLHLLNFIALLSSLLSFEFFMRAFLRARRQSHWSENHGQDLSESRWWALGYGLFLSTSLFVLTASITTPDILVAALTYLAAGLVLHIYSNGGGWRLFATLGFVLGCAYLTKTFYFPMSFVFLATASLVAGNPSKTIRQAVVGLAVFSLIAGPWVSILSTAKNRLTFGDVGKLALVIFIDQLPQHFFWQGEHGTGTPKHPVRQLMTKPRVFEFGTPVGGTYPPAFDLSYWMEGAQLRFNVKGPLLVVRQSAGTMFQFFIDQAEYAVGLLLLFFLARKSYGCLASFRKQWFLWVPALIGCFSYVVVLVEGRYVAPFVLLMWISAYSCLLSSPSQARRSAITALVLSMLSVSGLRIAKFGVSDLLASLAHPQNTDFEIARGLQDLGIRPGDRVAGLSRVAEAHWARLAGVRIVAEIPLGDEITFWTAPPDLKREVLDVVAGTGAKAIVTNHPFSVITAGWTPLGRTGYYVFRLPPAPGAGNVHP